MNDLVGGNKVEKLAIKNIFLKSEMMFCEVIAKCTGMLKARPGTSKKFEPVKMVC